MENFNIAKWKKNFLNENTQEKYQIMFHDYSGDDVPYTEKLFNTKMEADRFAQEYESDEEVEVYKDGDYRYETRYRYYNPEDRESYFGYHIEKVVV